MPNLIKRHKVGVSLLAIAVALGLYVYPRAEPLFADPSGAKDCGPVPEPSGAAPTTGQQPATIPPLAGVTWKQIGGSINDASCLNRTSIYGIVQVASVEDIIRTLAFARQHGLKVSAAGVKHSMGGHAFRRGSVVLDMTAFNRVTVNDASRTMNVQAGATWHDIQYHLHPKYAVRAMQSTDIFTVGGSISVNAHGMDHQAGALMRSIKSMRVMLADGTIEEISPAKNPELFNLVVGGYGLFGIILDAELEIADNAVYATGRDVIEAKEFPDYFAKKVEPNKDLALMYAHLSTARSSFLRELLVYTYTRADDTGVTRKPPGEITGVKLRRLVFNLAKLGSLPMELKWFSEKHIEHRMESCTVTRAQAIASGEVCLVSRNDPMHDSVPYLRNAMQNDTDILHEYFIPRSELNAFIDGMRKVFEANGTNLLNASIRVVDKETNFLSYAPEPAFSVVLYINQSADEDGNRKMQKLTRELIELTLSHRGRFFLPYQLHYTADQLKRSYPQIGAFFAAKRKYDPDGVFTNTFHETYAGAVGS